MEYTSQDIRKGLKSVGLKEGDTVIVHSSYKSIGQVTGGAETIITEFIDFLGPEGTLLFPALCNKGTGEFKCFERCYIDWDIDKSHSYVGYLSEFFRQFPGVVRSNQATHSVAAYGKKAQYFTEGHDHAYGWLPAPHGQTAYGKNSPWEKIYRENINYLFIGANLSVMTILHFVQQKYLEIMLPNIDKKSLMLRSELADFAQPGLVPNFSFPGTENLFNEKGFMRYGKMGNAELKMVVKVKNAIDCFLDELLNNPGDYFSGPFLDWVKRAST